MKLKLLAKRDEIPGVKSFFWEPESRVDWEPGQYYYFTIPELKYPDTRGDTRHFTISSSPTERNGLMLTTKIREISGYKKTLDTLPIGTEVEGEGPNGTFFLDKNSLTTPGNGGYPNIFVAGGIGITPYRSMIKYVIDSKKLTPIYLIYSNSDENFIFGNELANIAESNENIKIEFYNSSKDGHLDKIKIKSIVEKWNVADWKKSTWWVCGPPLMVRAIEDVLGWMDITSDHIRSEKFTGY